MTLECRHLLSKPLGRPNVCSVTATIDVQTSGWPLSAAQPCGCHCADECGKSRIQCNKSRLLGIQLEMHARHWTNCTRNRSTVRGEAAAIVVSVAELDIWTSATVDEILRASSLSSQAGPSSRHASRPELHSPTKSLVHDFRLDATI